MQCIIKTRRQMAEDDDPPYGVKSDLGKSMQIFLD